MRGFVRLSIVAAIVAAAIAPVAQGAPWQTAVPVSGPSSRIPKVVVDDQGNSTAVWFNAAGAETFIEGATRPAGGVWGPAERISPVGQGAWKPRLVVDGAGTVTVVWRNTVDDSWYSQTRTRGGAWSSPLLVPGGPIPDSMQVVGSSGGAMAVVWAELDPTSGYGPTWATVKLAGTTWGNPQIFGYHPSPSLWRTDCAPQAAFDGAGVLTLVRCDYQGSGGITHLSP